MTTIEQIARDSLGIPTLETRNSDRLDFHNVAVWNLKEALEDAFAAGNASIVPRRPVLTLICTLSDLLAELANAADESATGIVNGASQNQAIGTILHLEEQLPVALALLKSALSLHRFGGQEGAA